MKFSRILQKKGILETGLKLANTEESRPDFFNKDEQLHV